mmetsp:Transcript_11750/g.12809  ORF Transcript_11750/g.12809 Transcript_11750/m.12809 type:complete len:82 (+) Transcript_11750:42-287(+)
MRSFSLGTKIAQGPFAESNRLIYLLPFHFLISLSNEILFFGHENCTRPIRRIKSIDLFASLSLLSNEIPNSYDTTIFSNGV